VCGAQSVVLILRREESFGYGRRTGEDSNDGLKKLHKHLLTGSERPNSVGHGDISGSHGGEYEDGRLLGCYTASCASETLSTFHRCLLHL
jgi:hypothetical protein